MVDINDIIYNNVPIDKLSKNDYIEIINLLRNEYRSVVSSRNRETLQNELSDLQNRLRLTEERLNACQKSTKNMSGILNRKLSWMERLLGRIDLKKSTRF